MGCGGSIWTLVDTYATAEGRAASRAQRTVPRLLIAGRGGPGPKLSSIVTFNERDFPADVLESFGLEAQHPDAFAENLFDLDQATVVAAAQRQRQQLKSPPMDVDRYLDILRKQEPRRSPSLNQASASSQSVRQESR